MSQVETVPPASPEAPMRPITYAPVAVEQTRGADGSIVLRSRMPLAPFEVNLAKMFRAAVETAPGRAVFAERAGADWRKISYADARRQVDAIAAALIERGLSAERPIMILSGNAIDHALLLLGACTAGIPVAPVSVAYSLQSQDHGKLKDIAKLLNPGLIYVSDTAPFAKALAALDLANVEVVANAIGAGLERVTPFAQLVATTPGPAVERAVAAITPDTIVKFLFTSGSTGHPKAVINTHGMLTANQQQMAQVWPFLTEQDLVLVDWMPWNHTFGGNHDINMVLRHAGTLYIDAGRPVPALLGETLRNLKDVSPTIYLSVPAGYAALMPHLETDEALARSFFGGLRLIFYAGAALPQDLWTRLDRLALRVTGTRIPMTSSWGTTETSPAATGAHFMIDRAGMVGVPLPAVEVKLVPAGDKAEIRVRGPNVTPGYWKRPDLTAEAFDEEGFYRPGDAMRLADPLDPGKGLIYDGRIAENFKLTTGTWVHVGALRVGMLAACSPAIQDAVIAGEDQDFVGALVWLNAAGCQSLAAAGAQGAAPAAAGLHAHPGVRDHIVQAIRRWNLDYPGTSTRVMRVLLLKDAPSIDANEITDKGYINQRRALELRRADVERLFAAVPDDEVIIVG
jgi:feruloyl-CoA synthase